MTALRSSALHTGAGFLAMGAWAAFANRTHPMPTPLIAGAVQGTISAVLTFVLKRIVEAVSARNEGVAAVVLPTLAAWAVSFSGLVLIHIAAGTPELWATIALPNAVATCYAGLYAAAIRRQ